MLSRTLLATIVIITQCYTSLAAEGHNHGGHDHGDEESDIFCAIECVDGNKADPCGDNKRQQESCVDGTGIITMLDKFGYSDTSPIPSGGFLGCSLHACEELCMKVTMDKNSTDPMTVVEGDDGVKTFCFPKHNETTYGMFMMKDHAEMSAISWGCTGSHMMNKMYMHGASHGVCEDSYDPDGNSAPLSFTWNKIALAISLGVISMLI